MNRDTSTSVRAALGLFVALFLSSSSLLAQDDGRTELADLVRAVTRLVDTLEREARCSGANEDLKSISLAIQVLDIRTRQYESLQRELRTEEDQLHRLQGVLASRQSTLEGLEHQIPRALDDAERAGLEQQRDHQAVIIESLKKQVAQLDNRRSGIQNRVILLDRSTAEIEGIVADWLDEMATSSEQER